MTPKKGVFSHRRDEESIEIRRLSHNVVVIRGERLRAVDRRVHLGGLKRREALHRPCGTAHQGLAAQLIVLSGRTTTGS